MRNGKREVDTDELFECCSCGIAYMNEEQAIRCCSMERGRQKDAVTWRGARNE
jgi:hypothetical protein